MHLQGDELEDFIRAYENAFNERITPAQAHELFLRLLHLYGSIKPIPEQGPRAAAEALEPLAPDVLT